MLRGKRGSSYVYVVILLALLMILGTGFTFIIRFHMSVSANHHRKLERDYLAKSIHRVLCAQAEAGELEILSNMLNDAISQADAEAEEENEYYYQAATGEQVLILTNGESLTVQLKAACTIEPGTDFGSAELDTYVKFDQGDAYRMSALLLLDGEDGGLNENSRWVVLRHYQTEEIE